MLWSVGAAPLLSPFGGLPVGSIVIQQLLLAEPSSPDHTPSPSSWGFSPTGLLSCFPARITPPGPCLEVALGLCIPVSPHSWKPSCSSQSRFQMPPPTGSLPYSHHLDVLGQIGRALRASGCPTLSTRTRLMADFPGRCPRISPRARMMSSPWVSAPPGWLGFLLTARAQ